MKKQTIRIKSLNDLEAFLLTDVSIETKYNVWTEALDQYPFHVIEVKYSQESKEIETDILPHLKRIIGEIRNNEPIHGFWVAFKD